MTAEFKLFCELSRRHAALKLANVPALAPQLAEVRDDLEVMALHTDWPRLRAAIGRTLAEPTDKRAAL